MTDRAFEDDIEPAAAEAAAPTKQGLPLKFLLLFVGGPLLALLVVAVGLWLTGVWPFSSGHKEEAAAAHAETTPKQQPAVFFDMPDLLVNLNATGRKTTFLKLSIALELESQADIPKVQALMPRVIDNFQVYLRELRAEDIKGSAGMYRLREELLSRVAVAAAPVQVKDVLFREVLVQ
jgi:flagellar FliL protein